jgi:hypothetical protein
MSHERNMLLSISEDCQIRKAVARGMGRPIAPYLVYTDFDHSDALTSINPRDLPAWDELSEYMKIAQAWVATVQEQGFAFTVNVHPDLEKQWLLSNKRANEQVQKRLKKELDKQGIGDLPYAYVIEARSKTTRSRKKLHLHGYLCPANPVEASKFKVALEYALLGNNLKKVGRSRAIDIRPAYDRGHDARWAIYIMKNYDKYDRRLAHGRTFMSRAMTQGAREFWSLVRDEPL